MIVAAGIAIAAAATAFGALAHTATPSAAAAASPSVGSAPPSTGASSGAGGSAAASVAAVDAVSAGKNLAAGERDTAYFSRELVAALGYAPETSPAVGTNGTDGNTPDGALALRPDGDCSSPVPLPTSFETPCKTHDLGYDLLRIAHAGGAQIPADLRPALDRQLGERMAASCAPAHNPLGALEYGSCRTAASVAEFAVEANTLRQHRGAPVEERFPW